MLENFIREELTKRGYQPVYTPHIGRVELYQISGHFPYYADSQFKPIVMSDDERYLLKPMNCPHHIMIYKSKPRSYRDLPVRLAEFGTVYRYEQSGELGGMTRVRGFTQDDAHLFCTEEQVADEFRGCIEMTQFVLAALGLTDYRVRLGFRDPDERQVRRQRRDLAAGRSRARRRSAASMDLPHLDIERGEAAFYGPKVDFVVSDCIGREWQLGTVQLDYNLPSAERFALEYIGADNQPHRPVMIHRAPFGSLERFIGMLIEHFAGAFPLWLAPEQVRVLTVSEKSEDYGRQVEQQLRAGRLARRRGDYRAEKLGSKIRDAQLELIPYMFVVGPRDAEQGTVSVRDRIDGDLGAMPLAAAIEKLKAKWPPSWFARWPKRKPPGWASAAKRTSIDFSPATSVGDLEPAAHPFCRIAGRRIGYQRRRFAAGLFIPQDKPQHVAPQSLAAVRRFGDFADVLRPRDAQSLWPLVRRGHGHDREPIHRAGRQREAVRGGDARNDRPARRLLVVSAAHEQDYFRRGDRSEIRRHRHRGRGDGSGKAIDRHERAARHVRLIRRACRPATRSWASTRKTPRVFRSRMRWPCSAGGRARRSLCACAARDTTARWNSR